MNDTDARGTKRPNLVDPIIPSWGEIIVMVLLVAAAKVYIWYREVKP